MQKEELLKVFENTLESTLSSWAEFLEFKSISTDSAYEKDCRDCANWLVRYLEKIGFKSELIETESKPLVYAEYKPVDKAAKTVLYYGHYDVQPADPIELWQSDPFKPELRNERMYARGAEDNKGQTFYVIRALENLIKNNALKLHVKLLIEGEEETGSEAIKKTLPKIQDKIKAETLMVCDTGSLAADFATITMGLRGIISFDIRLDGPKYDLHSGVHGGIIPNPATELARLIASLHDEKGKIAVAGYYDEMTAVIPKDLELANAAPFDLKAYEEQVGISSAGGEKGLSFTERRGFRPTLEVNGLVSGYGGEGGKTIIPSHAIAKISARIAAGQSAEKCMERIEAHLKKYANPALKLTIPYKKIGGDCLYLSSETQIVKTAKSVLDQIFDKPTVFMWEGASIPIIPDVAKYSGAEPLVIGFGLEEDQIHAPNESFSVQQFKHGFFICQFITTEISGMSENLKLFNRESMPLAEEMRPKTWQDFEGIANLDANLMRQIQSAAGKPPSLILWGPPGSGKTTFAKLVGKSFRSEFVEVSAVLVGVKEIREIVAEAKKSINPTILFVDEIHRFNRAQQDAFLPHVENGTIILIGATTENPSFYLNAALLSRAKVLVFKSHDDQSLRNIVKRSTEFSELSFNSEAEELIISFAGGDARKLLNLVEALKQSMLATKEGELTFDEIKNFIQDSKVVFYDRSGEEHYNVISAFIKSMRGSDPDAALYWGFRMLEAGEDPLFVIRRMIIFASEDIGNADPRALQVAVATNDAFERLGLPEGRIPIAQCITYLASAPKSNRSYKAMHKAVEAVGNTQKIEVPMHLRNAPTKLMKSLGYGDKYLYPHEEEGAFAVGVDYLPEKLKNSRFYEPSDRGYEKNIKEKIGFFKED